MFKTILINILIGKCRRQFFVDSLRCTSFNYDIRPQKISLPPHTTSESLDRFGEYVTLSRDYCSSISLISMLSPAARLAPAISTPSYTKKQINNKKRHVWCVSQVPCVLVTNRWLLTTILGEVKTRESEKDEKARDEEPVNISLRKCKRVFRWETREGILYF